jgi:hypothetical protein
MSLTVTYMQDKWHTAGVYRWAVVRAKTKTRLRFTPLDWRPCFLLPPINKPYLHPTVLKTDFKLSCLLQDLTNNLFSRFRTRIVYAFFIYHMHATCPLQMIPFDLLTHKMLDKIANYAICFAAFSHFISLLGYLTTFSDTCIRQMTGSNLSRVPVYPCWGVLWFSSVTVNSRIVLEIKSQSLPSNSLFMKLSYHSMLCRMGWSTST